MREEMHESPHEIRAHQVINEERRAEAMDSHASVAHASVAHAFHTADAFHRAAQTHSDRP
jgi:hypothetical protein